MFNNASLCAYVWLQMFAF